MAFTFDATAGGATANSLCTVEFADDHLGGELYAAEWAALSNGVPAELLQKQQALVKATRRLERYEYAGGRVTETQRLKHPRYGLMTDDGFALSSTEVIEQFRMACAELALHYLRQNPADVVDEGLRQFKRLKIAGAIELETRDQLPSTDDVPAHVLNLIRPWLSVGPASIRLLRA